MQATTVQKQTPLTDQFTVARIAGVLGRDVREMRRVLANREPDGQCLVAGNVARTYLLSAFPEGIRLALADQAKRRGFDCPERMLQLDCERWAHSVPVAEIHPEEIARAKKRAAALADFACAFSDGSRPAAEVVAGAVLAYRQALGYEITGATAENLLCRAIRRDASRGELGRWELYVPENPKRRPADGAKEQQDDFAHLGAYLDGVNVAAPTITDRSWAWTAMCEEFQTLLEAGENPRAARRRLISHVFAHASWLSGNKQSLAKCFDEKWNRYCAGERFLADRRPTGSGNHRELPLTEDDEKMLIARGLTHGGGLTAAWRNSLSQGDLSAAVTALFITNPASKSYVPARVRALVSPKINMLQDIHHGPRQAKLKGAHITRDWSNVSPGDWYQADDTTLCIYYWEEDATGEPRVLRGQFLPMADCRTARVLSYALISERTYTAKSVRGLILSTHDTYGLPRVGFHFENGIWRSSKLIKGVQRPADFVETGETEQGLREWVRFMHAEPGNARSKVIEGIIGQLQNRMEDQPGYVGRNEQIEKFERVQTQLRAITAGRLHPSKILLHRDEWCNRLTEVCDAYNNEGQEGRLKGQSPREAWESLFDTSRPLVKLTAETRYLLANHRRPLKVTKNGVCVQLGKERHWFRNQETGRLIGRIVQGYFDPEDLSSVFIKINSADRVAVVVPAAASIPAMSATPEQMTAAKASVAAHNQPARTLYRAIKPYFTDNGPSPFRQVVADSATIEAGREIQEQKDALKKQQQSDDQQRRQLSRYDRRIGPMPGGDAISVERRLAAAKLLEETN